MKLKRNEKKAYYKATTPDGVELQVGSFHMQIPDVWMHLTKHDGVWHANTISLLKPYARRAPKGVEETWVQAKRVR